MQNTDAEVSIVPLNPTDNITNLLQSFLNVQSRRSEVIAGNIANADTPGYIARDMDFAKTLREATGSLQPARQMAATAPGHIGGSTVGGMRSDANLLYATPSQTNLDGNSVDMDRERANFADNAVKYEATLRFINGNVRTMLDAIRGQ